MTLAAGNNAEAKRIETPVIKDETKTASPGCPISGGERKRSTDGSPEPLSVDVPSRDDPPDSITDELDRKVRAKPHWQQAEMVAFPNGVFARDLAVELALSLERSGKI